MKFHSWFLALTLCTSGLVQAQIQKPTALKRLDAVLLASNGKSEGTLGTSVAVSGNVVAVATAQPNFPVYLFSRLAKGTTHEIATVSASDGALLYSVAVGNNGRLVVAGAINETIGNHPGAGAVYVFVEPAGGWTGNTTETAKLSASDAGTTNYDNLGASLATTNGVIVAGAPQFDGVINGPGEAYVFVEPKGGWVNGTETARLKASDGQLGDVFGGAIAVVGPRVVVGAPHHDANGAAYVFQEPRGGWKTMTETAELANAGSREGLGDSVALLGGNPSTVAVGAPGATPRGAVYIYVEPAGGWVNTSTPTATITSPKSLTSPHQCLGVYLAIGPQLLAVGDNCEIYGHNGSSIGDTYVYLTPEGGWHDYEGGIAIRPKGAMYASIPAVAGNRVIIGAPDTTVGNNSYEGEVLIYTVPVQ